MGKLKQLSRLARCRQTAPAEEVENPLISLWVHNTIYILVCSTLMLNLHSDNNASTLKVDVFVWDTGICAVFA